MSLGLLKGRGQPGSIVAQPGSVLQHVVVIDSPQCRGVKKTIVVRLLCTLSGHVTKPDGSTNAETGKPNLQLVGSYDFVVGQLVRFPADEAERLIAKRLASVVTE